MRTENILENLRRSYPHKNKISGYYKMSTTYFFYKIHNPNLPYCYIGRTRDPRARLSTHKTKSLTSELDLYRAIRENGGWSAGWRFDILETSEMTTAEAMKKERELYDNNEANLNMLIPNNNPGAYSYYQ